MNICSFETKLRPTFYKVPNFEHVFSPFPRQFAFSLKNRLLNNVYCTEDSEIMREVFRYVIYAAILSSSSGFYHGLHAWHEMQLNLH